jgi:hypothetical protein
MNREEGAAIKRHLILVPGAIKRHLILVPGAIHVG